ncbi:MAG: hypothetical protein FWF24_06590 [Alphaproteobacteria bacterium]|nr:hypothetical protein [Alphaproteobacteria bacterium]
MWVSSRLFLFALVALSAACSFQAENVLPPRYELPSAPGERLCVQQCRAALAHCESSCALQERACVQDAQTQAIKDYEAYVRSSFSSGEAVDLRLSDFERIEVCRAESCRRTCTAYFDDCFTTCGGKLEKVTSCQFLCF